MDLYQLSEPSQASELKVRCAAMCPQYRQYVYPSPDSHCCSPMLAMGMRCYATRYEWRQFGQIFGNDSCVVKTVSPRFLISENQFSISASHRCLRHNLFLCRWSKVSLPETRSLTARLERAGLPGFFCLENRNCCTARQRLLPPASNNGLPGNVDESNALRNASTIDRGTFIVKSVLLRLRAAVFFSNAARSFSARLCSLIIFSWYKIVACSPYSGRRELDSQFSAALAVRTVM